jgi:hypothetical protein
VAIAPLPDSAAPSAIPFAIASITCVIPSPTMKLRSLPIIWITVLTNDSAAIQ